jgi:hypothetical protein
VETCLLAEGALDLNAPLVVMDCDLFFRSSEYDRLLKAMARKERDAHGNLIGGLLVHFRSKAPRYSYALIDPETGYVTKTAEKIPISDHSLIGAYGFGSGRLFVDAARELMVAPIDPDKGMREYYVSLLFNTMLSHGEKVVAVPRDEYASFGTPDELAKYLAGEPSYVAE